MSCTGTLTIANLVEPNTAFGDRLTQLDLRFNQRIQVGHAQVTGKFDIYNIMNNATILTVNTRYGATYLQPTSVQSPRLFKVGVQVEF